jgi:hypothetical protein
MILACLTAREIGYVFSMFRHAELDSASHSLLCDPEINSG